MFSHRRLENEFGKFNTAWIQSKGGHLSSDVPTGNDVASVPIVGLSMRDTIHWDFPVMLAGCLAAGKTAFSGTEYDRTGTVEQPQAHTNLRRMENGLSKV